MIAVKMNKAIKIEAEKAPADCIVTQIKTKQEIDEAGNIVIKKIYKQKNLTKLINETAKLVKQNSIYSAEDKLNELKKVINK